MTDDAYTALHAQIAEETTGLLTRLEILLAPDFLEETINIRSFLEAQAKVYAAQLLSDDDHVAAGTITDLVCVLFPNDTPIPDSWWTTPLGRAAARSVGHPTTDAVSFSVAGAMLGGISKQRVSDLAKEGKLDRHPDGGITTDSIQQRLSQVD